MFLIFGTLRLFMMTTNSFAIANVKQMRTYVVLEFCCLFFRTSWCVGILNSAIFLTVFTVGLSLARFFVGPSEFRVGFEHPKPPLGTPLQQDTTEIVFI